MLTGIYQSLAFVLIIIAFYIMDFYLIDRYDRLRQASGSGRAWDFTFFIFVMVIILILQPVVFPNLGLILAARWAFFVQLLGMTIAILGLLLHAWARIHLQFFYSERVEVQLNHRVIDTGPYAFVRHPVITSFFSIVIGLFLINPAWTTLAMMTYTFWDFSRAALQEEELLKKSLPAYSAYMERTPRFLPNPWRKS
jgi:protein-S-isoprenylcysteine O-methyltransferase Ste14